MRLRLDRPSLTAAAVAFGRGVGLDHETHDTLAHDVVPAPFAQVLSAFERAGPRGDRLARPLVRAATLGLVDHASLRMAAVDEIVKSAARLDCEQVVILGAGLDTRAWRMLELADATVYEVDHPATQRHKRERVAGRPALAREVVFVPVDFEHQHLAEELAREGHDASRPTLWLWEAVTMYLRPPAIQQTLSAIADRSAPDTMLAVTYATTERPPLGRAVMHAARIAFTGVGEPLIGALDPAELHRRLAVAGFAVIEDTDSRDWSRRYRTGSSLLASPFRVERLASAYRVG